MLRVRVTCLQSSKTTNAEFQDSYGENKQGIIMSLGIKLQICQMQCFLSILVIINAWISEMFTFRRITFREQGELRGWCLQPFCRKSVSPAAANVAQTRTDLEGERLTASLSLSLRTGQKILTNTVARRHVSTLLGRRSNGLFIANLKKFRIYLEILMILYIQYDTMYFGYQFVSFRDCLSSCLVMCIWHS